MGEVISLPRPLASLRSPPPPLRARPSRPAPAPAPAHWPQQQLQHRRCTRAAGPRLACSEAGRVAPLAAVAQVRRAGPLSPPGRSCDAPTHPSQPYPEGWEQRTLLLVARGHGRCGQSPTQVAPGSALRTRAGRGKEGRTGARQVRGTWAAPKMPIWGGTLRRRGWGSQARSVLAGGR